MRSRAFGNGKVYAEIVTASHGTSNEAVEHSRCHQLPGEMKGRAFVCLPLALLVTSEPTYAYFNLF
jgi:hypothetical protein